MLPDVGATELLLIAAVALIVVGPKDLPMLMRKVGQFVARMRGLANEFRASFDEMARQTELDNLRKEVEALKSGNYMTDAQAAVSASHAEVTDVFNEIQGDLEGARPYVDDRYDPYRQDDYSNVDPQYLPAPEPAAEPVAAPKPRASRAKANGAAPKTAAKAKPKAPAAKAAAPKAPPKPRAPRKPKAEAGE